MAEQIHAEQIRYILENWSAISAALSPPSEDVAFYQQALLAANPCSGATVLLLDSTPELQNMVLRQGLRLTECNMGTVSWDRMPGLIATEGNQTFINANGLKEAEGQCYDFVLGGGSLEVLTPEEIQHLIAKIYRLLSRDGCVVLRTKTANKQLTLNCLRRAIAKYPTVRGDRPFLAYLHDLIESLRNTYFPTRTRYEFYESVVSEYLTVAEMADVRLLLRDSNHCYPAHTAFITLLQQYFEVLSCQPSAGSSWGTAHLYILQKKNAAGDLFKAH